MLMGITSMRMQVSVNMNMRFVFKINLAVFYRANFIRCVQRKIDIVGDDDIRLIEVGYDFSYSGTGVAVKCIERLIQQQNFRLHCQDGR